jgi:hypothetical protein
MCQSSLKGICISRQLKHWPSQWPEQVLNAPPPLPTSAGGRALARIGRIGSGSPLSALDARVDARACLRPTRAGGMTSVLPMAARNGLVWSPPLIQCT